MPRGQDTIRTVSFVSLGCPKNLVDSEKMLGLLAQEGLVPVSMSAGPEPERWDDARHVEGESSAPAGAALAPGIDDFSGADVVVVNTCGFLEASKDESLSVIKDAIAAKQAGHVKRVVVAGCLVQRHRAKMLEWAPGIDAMVGVFDRDKIIEAVRGGIAPPLGARPATAAEASDRPAYWIAGNALEAAQSRGLSTVGLTVQGKDGKGIGYFEDDSARLRLTPRHYAYLRISEGCNQRCAFCTIPSIRGKMRSKPLDRIVAEARELAADGAFELNLIGQDTTSYGDDIGLGLAQQAGSDPYRAGLPRMLKEVCAAVRDVSSSGWVRLMYAYPSNFSDEMIDAFAALTAQGVLVPYIDMPLQHASDRMLSAMRRHVTADQQRALVETLRERVPGLAIRTTFISGFPGETEADHQELLRFVSDMQFDALGVFEYSPEPAPPPEPWRRTRRLPCLRRRNAGARAKSWDSSRKLPLTRRRFSRSSSTPRGPSIPAAVSACSSTGPLPRRVSKRRAWARAAGSTRAGAPSRPRRSTRSPSCRAARNSRRASSCPASSWTATDTTSSPVRWPTSSGASG